MMRQQDYIQTGQLHFFIRSIPRSMDNLLQIAVFLLLTCGVAMLTYFLGRKKKQRDCDDTTEIFLAGRRLSWVFVAGSITLTNLSTDQLVGMNGAQAMVIVWWELAAVFGLFVLGKYFVPIYYRANCTTTNELLEQRYGDKKIRAVISSLLIISLAFISMPVLLYTGALFMQSTFAIDMPVVSIAAMFALVASLYAILGGLQGVAISGTLNGIGLALLGTLLTWLSLQAIDFDFSGIPAERLTLFGDNDSQIPWHTLLTGMPLIQVFYWCTNQYITQRALASHSIHEARKGVYAAAVIRLTIIPLLVAVPGIVAYKLYGPIGDFSYGRLVADLLPSWLSGAFAAVIAGAVISTLNAMLNSCASLYVCDIHQRYWSQSPNVKFLNAVVIFLCVTLSLVLVPLYSRSESIIYVVQQLHGLYSMPVLAVFSVALLLRGVDSRAVIATVLFGSLLYAFFTFVWTPLHFIHMMFITYVSCIGFALIVNRYVYGGSARLSFRP